MSRADFEGTPGTLSIERGVIRGGQAHVTMRLRGAEATLVELVALDSHGEAIGSWPACHDLQGADDTGQFTELSARSDLPPDHPPVQRFFVRAGAREIEMHYGEGYELKLLFYASEQDFRQSQIARRRGNRPLDQETQMFLARQMVATHFSTLTRSLELPASMAATYAYRATDIDDRAAARDAITYIDRLIAHIETLPASDFNQAWTMSLYTARWHAAATLRDLDLFVASMAFALDNIDALCENAIAYTMSYNVARTLMMLAAFYLASGHRDNVARCFDGLARILAAGGARITLNHAHLREFSMTCRICVVAGHVEADLQAWTGTLTADRMIATLKRTYGAAVLELFVQPANRSYNPDRFVGYFQEMVPAA